MKDVEREQRAFEDAKLKEEAMRELVWVRERRNLSLMRHPTNWAGASLLQVTCSILSIYG